MGWWPPSGRFIFCSNFFNFYRNVWPSFFHFPLISLGPFSLRLRTRTRARAGVPQGTSDFGEKNGHFFNQMAIFFEPLLCISSQFLPTYISLFAAVHFPLGPSPSIWLSKMPSMGWWPPSGRFIFCSNFFNFYQNVWPSFFRFPLILLGPHARARAGVAQGTTDFGGEICHFFNQMAIFFEPLLCISSQFFPTYI